MSKQFEHVCFEAEIGEHPGERTTQLAFIDWLCENGYTLTGAKRFVTRLVRVATERKLIEKVMKLLAKATGLGGRIREMLHYAVSPTSCNGISFWVVAGGVAPMITDDTGHWTDRETRQDLPGTYHEGTDVPGAFWTPGVMTITVGVAWITARFKLDE